MKLKAIVCSPRKENSYDFANYLLEHKDIIHLGMKQISPCVGCEYECLKKSNCPLDDDVKNIYEEIKESDGLIIFSPVFDSRPPALYFALHERLPGLWQRQSSGFSYFKKLKVGIVVVGNYGTLDTANIIEDEYRSLGAEVLAKLIINPKNYNIGGGVKGNLIHNEALKRELIDLLELF